MTGPGGGGREEIDGLHLVWVRAEDLPAGEGWLTPAERQVLAGLEVEKRRKDWVLGRWAAKLAVRAHLGRPAPDLSILAGDDGRPLACFGHQSGPSPGVSLSISHAGGVGFAVAKAEGAAVGCDIEAIEARSREFVSDYFTEVERDAVLRSPEDARDVTANLVWSAKEAALKALGEGLRRDTRSVVVDVQGLCIRGSEWSPLVVTGQEGRIFRGQWRVRDGLVWTLLTEAAS